MKEDALDKRPWMHAQPSYGPAWDAAIEVELRAIRDRLAGRTS